MAGATSASSPIYHHKLFNFSFTHSTIPQTLNSPHTTTTISPKPLILNPQLFNLSYHKFHNLHPPSCSFHQFEPTLEEQYPDTEPKTLHHSVPKSSQSKRILFVGNLPYSLSSSQLAQIFEQAGNVLSVEIVHDDFADRSRGYAFVTMGSAEEAKEAIRMFEGTNVGDRVIKVSLQSSVPKSSQSKRRLFVGNLPFSFSSSQLAQLFEEAGNVVSVEIVHDDFADRSRGFAFVTMGSVEEAEEAIRMFEGTNVGDRVIKVNFPEVPKVGKRTKRGSNYRGYVDSPHRIYAGNLGWDMTSQVLKEAFAAQKGLLSAKVIYERNTGKSRGYGFVTFETAYDVEAALNAMNGVEVQGRPLQLRLTVDNKKPLSPQVIDQNKGSNVDSLEMLFGI